MVPVIPVADLVSSWYHVILIQSRTETPGLFFCDKMRV
jgi:hypothetical protein